ncbi:META domain-containing protein [Kaistella palustris]|uniref:META domain-containing protein n=1 Tax=Kaistella palustris TaxID=493376 RepID=UPI00041A3676|nr:META domain-containing protein [Kaistella palustris]
MKRLTLIFFAVVSLFMVSCTANQMDKNQKLYHDTWELEYITGPRITFEGLFPDEKPAISFNKNTGTVTGTTGCNGYSTTYTLNGTSISFAQPGITTMRYCGDGEVVFLKTMQQITNFRLETDGKLTLLINDIPAMRFHKKENK